MPRTEEQFQSIREKTQAHILNIALELFAQKGFKGTTISDIAKAAGVSKGLAYNYFNSKDDLMKAVLNLLIIEMEKLFTTIKTIHDPYEKLRVIIETTFSNLKRDEKFWRLYTSFSLQPEVMEDSEILANNYLNEGFKLLENIFKQIGIKNPKNEAKLLGAIIDGMCFHYILNTDKYPLRQMKNFLLKKYSKKLLSAENTL